MSINTPRGMNSPTLNEYQRAATSTAIYPHKRTILGLAYTVLKLNGEAGEVAENVGKAMRDDASVITDERKEKLLLELGDVLWYIAASAAELGFTLQEVAEANVEKLLSRHQRGKVQGSGDNR